MPDTPETAASERKCDSCAFRGPPESFPINARTGQRTRRCERCNNKNTERIKAARLKKKESRSTPGAADATDSREPPACQCVEEDRACAYGQPRPHPIVSDSTSDPLTWSAFSALLSAHTLKPCDITVLVELEDTSDDVSGERVSNSVLAGNIVRLIKDKMGYKFNLHEVTSGQQTERFKYYCAQRKGMETKSQRGVPRAGSTKERGKPRATPSMDRWHCEGWLSISIVHTADSEQSYGRIHLYHGLGHKAFKDVAMPEDIKELVREMQNSTASTIFKEVLRRFPDTTINQHQVYTYWSTVTTKRWKLDDNQLESTQLLLQQCDGDQVQIIPVRSEDGVTSFAFAFKEIVERLNTGVVELAMDSTFKTNALGHEMYALLTEVNGQLMPLVTILTSLTHEAHAGAKERLLEDALRWLHAQCPNIHFSLSDKDPSEINACRTVLEDEKHQLCYWHSIRYLEERLAQSTPPAAYDGRNAHRVFSFIDPTWGPGVDNGRLDEDFDGTGSVSISVNSLELQVDDLPIDELETCLPPLFTLTIGNDSIPFWPPPVARKDCPKLPEFCPSQFRPHIISMFRKHFHLHPEIPLDEHGTHLTADQIHKSAVHQIYTFCWEHDLSQVWAYLWNRWYSPPQWSLWARAACRAIPVLKTTMVVESYWRIVKHRDLAAFNRPRLDLLVYTLIHSTLPPLLQRLNEILGVSRDGRASGLASWQKDFKAEWLELSKPDERRNLQRELDVLKKKGKGLKHAQARADRLAEIEADRLRPRGDYHTDLERWTCSCPAFLLSRFLLCKHLVRKANRVLGEPSQTDNSFWRALRRRRLPPYYAIPGIHETPEHDPVYHPQLGPRVSLQAVQPTSPARSRSSTPDSDLRIDEHDPSRIYMSSPEKRKLQDDLNTVLDVLTQPQGVDPRLRKRVEPALSRITDFSDNVRSAKRARTSQRTYRDTNADTLFLD